MRLLRLTRGLVGAEPHDGDEDPPLCPPPAGLIGGPRPVGPLLPSSGAGARDAYAEIGRPSIDPVVFFKLQLVLFFEGLRSERQLLRVVADRLSLR